MLYSIFVKKIIIARSDKDHGPFCWPQRSWCAGDDAEYSSDSPQAGAGAANQDPVSGDVQCSGADWSVLTSGPQSANHSLSSRPLTATNSLLASQ